MGKGQRSRQARAGKREELKKIAAKKKIQAKIKKIVGISVASLAAIAVIGGVAYTTVASTGFFLRNTVAMKTDNYQIDNAMMTYYTKNQYYSFANQNADYLQMFGLDTSKSLSSQKYGEQTWLEYFLSQAKEQGKETLALAEKAKAEGITLDEEDNKSIDQTIANFKAEADSNKLTIDNYYTQVFGKGIKEDDVRRAVTLSTLASKYYDKFEKDAKYTDDDLKKYFDEHPSEFIKADYLSYTVPGETEDEIKANATKFQAAKTVEEFTALLEAEFTQTSTANYLESNKITDATTLTEEQKAEIQEEIKTSLDDAKATASKPAADAKDTAEFNKWLFQDGRAVNEIYTEQTAADAEKNTKFSIKVYMVTKPAYSNDYAVAKARHILFSTEEYETDAKAKAKAEEVLALYNADPKEENFIKLAKEHSNDASTKENGGLYEQITKDTASWPEAFTNWCYAEGRKAGDVEIVKTDAGYHIMYYVGTGEILWKLEAKNSLMTADYEALIEELTKTYTLVQNDKKMKAIKG